MKRFFCIVSLIFFSCNIPEIKKTENIFFYTGAKRSMNYKSDTLTLDKINSSMPEYALVIQTFQLNGKSHTIKMFTNDLNAGHDGGELFYQLDSLGIIYSRSTTLYSYRRLRSNNDSINFLIDVALENILLYPKLCCYENNPYYKDTLKFEPPTGASMQ